MEHKILHSHLLIGGLNLHMACIWQGRKRNGGFPEIWYTWRNQIVAVAEAGYHAIAPDYRGNGLSDQPKDIENAKWQDLIDDLHGILDSLQIPKEPGRAEADIGRFDVKTVVGNIYILFSSSEIPIAAENQEIMDLVVPSTPLPPWFTEKDPQDYADLYEKSSFKYPLQMPYRWSLEKGDDPKVEVPTMLIMGEKDYVLKFSGMEGYIIRSGMVKQYFTNLEGHIHS